MAVFATVTFAAFLFEDDNFFTFYEGDKNLAVNFCTFNGRSSDFNVAVGFNEEHLVENDCVAFFDVVAEMIDIQIFAGFGFELQAFDFYDCVHCCNY